MFRIKEFGMGVSNQYAPIQGLEVIALLRRGYINLLCMLTLK